MSQDFKIYKCSQCGNEIRTDTSVQNCICCNGTKFFIDLESYKNLSSSYNELTEKLNNLEDYFKKTYEFPIDSWHRRLHWSIDWCFCVDATNSMTSFLENVKEQIIDFPQKLESNMNKRYMRVIHQHRIKIIMFSDFNLCSPEKYMIISPFFYLRHPFKVIEASNQKKDFEDFVWKIKTESEGSDNANSLEALALAMKSSWESNPIFMRKRHIIVLYTDKSAYPLENNSSQKILFQDIPKNFAQLTDEWDKLPLKTKRLIVFAPEVSPWDEICNSWENMVYFPSQAGEGLGNDEMEQILAVLHDDI